MSAFSLGLYEIGARALIIALKEQPNDMVMQDQLEKYKEKLGEARFADIQLNPVMVVAPQGDTKGPGIWHNPTRMPAVPGAGGSADKSALNENLLLAAKFIALGLIVGGTAYGLLHLLRRKRNSFEGDKIV